MRINFSMFKDLKKYAIIKINKTLFYKGDLKKMIKSPESTTIINGSISISAPCVSSTPIVTGTIAKEVLKEALSTPSEEAIKRINRDSELLKQLRST